MCLRAALPEYNGHIMTPHSQPQALLEPLDLADTLNRQADHVLQEIHLGLTDFDQITQYLIQNGIKLG